jgi:hypothetical protein
MLDRIIAQVPEQWREVAELVLAPISWIPRLQEMLVAMFLESPSRWALAAKYVFLLLPALLGLAALWCTQLSLYTLPFRSARAHFISLMLLAWWDAARAVWLYWVGIVRLAAITAGWILTLTRLVVRLVAEAVRHVATMPFLVTGRVTRAYFQPGVPWIAFVMLIFWCVLEAAIFTYTVFPTASEILNDLVISEETARFTAPVLFLFLLTLILGSFAGLQALVDGLRRREVKFFAQILLVQIFAMFFQVMFLYREVVDAVTPWIAQQTGVRPGFWLTFALAGMGWAGVRSLTWYLFGQYGTPSLLAFIARRPIVPAEGIGFADFRPVPVVWWRAPLEDCRREIEWLHVKSEQLVEYLALPALQVFAATLNFGMVVVASRPAFQLPFATLKEATEARQVFEELPLLSRKPAAL